MESIRDTDSITPPDVWKCGAPSVQWLMVDIIQVKHASIIYYIFAKSVPLDAPKFYTLYL